ncbi:DUF6198 family protein [Clostridium sp. KNHs205]|uniref:DUF6198 family protein n=1 Tax=Clostridium sp. KNHs205 TaxID=1449050 RepID=UPI00051B7516|nr:DUF6198 family protein [Clostridium sp. KNHs205]
MKKLVFYTELSYILGIILLAFGTAIMEKANFGVSMVVAPAYLVFKKLSLTYTFFTFGMAEYMLQAILLIFMVLLLKKFRISYLFSFLTAIYYGLVLDVSMNLIARVETLTTAMGVVFFFVGLLLCAVGVAFMFHTYISPEVYELFVKKVSEKFHIKLSTFKTIYDCASCLAGILLSFLFFGLFEFEGVKAGTVICALINGKLIGVISNLMEKHLEFKDALPARRYFDY